MKRLLLAAAALAVAAGVLPAQTYKTVVETRQVDAGNPLDVDVTFAVGTLLVRPSDRSTSYRLAMKYAEDHFDPSVRFTPSTNRLAVKLEGIDGSGDLDDFDGSEQSLDLALPPDVPLDLSVSFGALEADMELGGLTLRSAKISTGASESVISFSTPTQGTCASLEFTVGAAEFEAVGLGNAACRVVEFKGGVGEVVLDFTGTKLTAETRLRVTVGLGEVTIRVPEAIGIRLDADRFLASIKHDGLVKRGSRYLSPNYDDAAARLVVEVNAVLGSIEIERVP